MAEAKETFNSNPALYDEMRPSYPLAVLQGIDQFAGLTQGSSVLEVGPGTGQASDYFIRRGYQFTGIDLGEDLVAFATKKYKDFPNAAFHHARFEEWEQGYGEYDLILGAQCFHWLDPLPAVNKSTLFLKPGGAMALMWNTDISSLENYYLQSQPIFDEYYPDQAIAPKAGSAEWFARYAKIMAGCIDFRTVEVIEEDWHQFITGDQWVRLRSTYSDDMMLAAQTRTDFHRKLVELIDSMGGTLTLYYKTLCAVGRLW